MKWGITPIDRISKKHGMTQAQNSFQKSKEERI